MIIKRNEITGIDAPILRIQKVLDSLGFADVLIYGRLYRNLNESGEYRAEAYVGRNEYKDVFIDDSHVGTIGVITRGRESVVSFNSAEIDVVFTINLEKLFGTSERYDEKLIEQYKSLLTENGFNITAVKTGVESVFDGYEIEPYRFRDMQPNLVFSLSTSIMFNDDSKCN